MAMAQAALRSRPIGPDAGVRGARVAPTYLRPRGRTYARSSLRHARHPRRRFAIRRLYAWPCPQLPHFAGQRGFRQIDRVGFRHEAIDAPSPLDRLMHHGHLLKFVGNIGRLEESPERLAKVRQSA